MTKTDITTIDEYIANFPREKQEQLQKLRGLIKAAAPHAKEAIKWGQPAFTDPDGMILVMFGGYKNHMNLVGTPSTKEALAKELAGYETGKGSVKFSYEKPLPAELIKSLVTYRVTEYRDRQVKWM